MRFWHDPNWKPELNWCCFLCHSFSTAYQCIYYSPEHTAKAQEVLSSVSLLQPLITSLADQLLQAAQERSSSGLKDVLKNLSDKVRCFSLVHLQILQLHWAFVFLGLFFFFLVWFFSWIFKKSHIFLLGHINKFSREIYSDWNMVLLLNTFLNSDSFLYILITRGCAHKQSFARLSLNLETVKKRTYWQRQTKIEC